MRIAWVAPSVLKIRLQCVQVGVRWAANQRGIVRSPSTLPWPSLVISSPMPTMMPRISTQATRTAAAMRPGGAQSDLRSGDPHRVPAGRLEVGAGLGFQSLGDRVGYRLAGGAAGQLEGEGRDPEPGNADRPGAHHVG